MITLESIPTTPLVTNSKKQNINAETRAPRGTFRERPFVTSEILYLLLHHSQSFVKHE